jgi:hypothetical protein
MRGITGSADMLASRRTSRRYNSVVIQFAQAVLAVQAARKAARNSSHDDSTGLAIGTVMVRSTYA